MRICRPYTLLALAALLATACHPTRKAAKTEQKANPQVQAAVDSLMDAAKTPQTTPESTNPDADLPYRPRRTAFVDLVHTKLNLTPVFERSEVEGVAEVTVMPHFYPVDTLVLDAQMMRIKSIVWLGAKAGSTTSQAVYDYSDSLHLHIVLPKRLVRGEKATVRIAYTAQPEKVKAEGGNAISEAKGFYFINPTGKDEDKTKPRQFWTQGEPEANSVWMPTIEATAQKMTQEISITVPDTMVTLSNGLLTGSVKGKNNTRTDTWVQKQPHSPYLAMVAGGNFAVVKDQWKGKEVSYYVEPKFKNSARDIFGRTPAMIEFFSTVLGTPFAWDKYSQIAVRDYVSGAMENTTAVTMIPSVQRTKREMLDEDADEIICHELFHHWFGDLATANTWSMLFLNESFATYGEYLWIEHAKGRMAADEHMQEALNRYLSEARRVQHSIVRYRYKDPNDLFDRHTYQKGGNVLHLLRHTVGDDAFFAALKLYLSQHRFGSADAEDLRKAFEQVTGQDMEFFFSAWFYRRGHPVLNVDATLQGDSLIATVNQSSRQSQLFPLTVELDEYHNGVATRRSMMLTNRDNRFAFKVAGTGPTLAVFDPEGVIPGKLVEVKTREDWARMLVLAPQYRAKHRALVAINSDNATTDSSYVWALLKALQHPSDAVRVDVVDMITETDVPLTDSLVTAVRQLAERDPMARVRAHSVALLAKYYARKGSAPNAQAATLFSRVSTTDSSYETANEALKALALHDSVMALKQATRLEKDAHFYPGVAKVYAKYGDVRNVAFMGRLALSSDRSDAFTGLQGLFDIIQNHPNDLALFDAAADATAMAARKQTNADRRKLAYSGLGAMGLLARNDSVVASQGTGSNTEKATATRKLNAIRERIRAGVAQETEEKVKRAALEYLSLTFGAEIKEEE